MISNDIAERILAAVDAQFDAQLERTSRLVASPSLRAGEEPAQDLIEQHLRDLGLDVDRWTIDSPKLRAHPGFGKSTVDYGVMTNVVGTYEPTENLGKSLILNGHIDVVPEGPEEKWSRSPWDAEIRDGWMYGRGAGDMKAGLIANLFAFDAIRKGGLELTGRVHLQSVVEEECTGNGSLAALLRGYTADAVIISEPEEDALVRANVGVLWFTVRVSGDPTHPREMANGFNAIDAAYEVIEALRGLEEEWNAKKGEHEYFKISTTRSTSTSVASVEATGHRACPPGVNCACGSRPTPARLPMTRGPRSRSALRTPRATRRTARSKRS